MVKGRPREYYSRYPLTVSVEKELWDFANQYGILARDAISLGFQGIIENDLIRTKRIPKEEMVRYMEIKNRELQFLISNRERESDIIKQVSEINETVSGLSLDNTLKPPEPSQINWETVPEDLKLATYILILMPEDFRAFWISKYNSADEDDRFGILTEFAKNVICRHKENPDKPFQLKYLNDIRNVLRSWADSARGFKP